MLAVSVGDRITTVQNLNEITMELKKMNDLLPPALKQANVRRSFWCRIGLHDWYHGNFSAPVWGRYERHCLECDKKQYAKYENKRRIWMDF